MTFKDSGLEILGYILLSVLFSIILTILITSHTIFPKNIIVANDLKKEIYKQNIIPDDYKIKKSSGLTAEKYSDSWWEIYVEIYNETKPKEWTNDLCFYDYKTKVIDCDFYYIRK